ncbi:MAG TPA: DUF1015 family protein [Pyrinomonadaceae bacterium]|nr:DUF1015 family protein [Pyrinomonadaceae bacterium]
MATIRPFRALRPTPNMADRVACVPYDVVDDNEVREFITENPLSFLRVTRPEAELSEQERQTAVFAFEQARKNLLKLIDEGILISDTEDSLYVYRLTTGEHRQTGVVACCSLDEYEQGLIRKHENTRPDKVENRTGHLLTLRAQTGLILLAYRGTEKIKKLAADATTNEALYDFHVADGTQHTIWRVSDTAPWSKAFSEVPMLYIADGHHRIESAATARKRILAGAGNLPSGDEYNFVMAGIFPAEDLRIMAYNRAVRDLNGLTAEQFLRRLQPTFSFSETDQNQPRKHGEICVYLHGKWYKLSLAPESYYDADLIERLDVSILQDRILSPILGIDDPRTDERIIFVGGKRGTRELERLVDSGDAAVSFSLFPTTMNDLLAVSDAGEIMPPKSTWFEPKLKDGLLIHKI